MIQSLSQNVVLEIVGGMNEGCGVAKHDFVRILANGKSEAGMGGLGWRVPAGQALVVTDVDWQYVHPQGAIAANKMQILRIFIENLNGDHSGRVFESTIVLSAHGEGGCSEAMSTGFVVSSSARLCPDVFPGPDGLPSGLQHLILRGYLIADTL